MSQKWSYNGLEFEVDMADVDFASKYEDAFDKLGEKEKQIPKTGKSSEVMKYYCNMFCGLFDDIYGAGTSQKMFDGRLNAAKCEEAYDAFLSAAKRDNVNILQKRAAVLNKYAPNRAQRRYNNKHKPR